MRKLFIVAFAFLAAFTSKAQDVITRFDGTDILAIIQSTDNDRILFKYWKDTADHLYEIDNSDVLMVRYNDGRCVVYPEGQKVLEGINAPAVPVEEEPAWSSFARPGMSYDEYKNWYDHRAYIPSRHDPYNPSTAGWCSFFFTGLGQGIDGEWGRAAGYFGLYWGFRLLAWSTADELDFDNGYHVSYSGISALLRLSATVVKVCSIVDAVRMAKVKNMYHQDLRHSGYAGNVQFDVQPFFANAAPSYGIGSSAGDLRPVTGLSFRLSF
ncbi:MAG: hypothetical protein K5652_05215 [Bacteroidales bacterium]|nr:hypothetical protein [Bacteroidales bacterium]